MPSFDLTQSFGPVAQQLGLLSSTLHGSYLPSVKTGAVLLLGAIREELSKPGTGRQYKIPVVKRDGTLKKTKRGKQQYRFHRASAPGEPPAVDTGELRRGTVIGLVGGLWRVGVTAKYGPGLEYGTLRIKPRPFMAPALARVKDEMGDLVTANIRQEVVRGFFR